MDHTFFLFKLLANPRTRKVAIYISLIFIGVMIAVAYAVSWHEANEEYAGTPAEGGGLHHRVRTDLDAPFPFGGAINYSKIPSKLQSAFANCSELKIGDISWKTNAEHAITQAGISGQVKSDNQTLVNCIKKQFPLARVSADSSEVNYVVDGKAVNFSISKRKNFSFTYR